MTSSTSLVWRQFRNQNRIFWRTPIAAFFTLVLPLFMLVLFVALFGNDTVDATAYGEIKVSQFYTPALAVFSAASATYTNIGTNLSARRDLGILKRVRGTPMPAWTYLAGVVLSAVWIALVATVVMVAFGVVAYDVNIELVKLPSMLLVFVVGSTTFATLGLALTAAARNSAAAQALTQATLLPLAFVSDIFINLGAADERPAVLDLIADVFPLKHFAVAFGETMSPFSDAPALEWGRLAVMAGWLLFGAVVAVRWFRWEAHPEDAANPRQRSRRSARSEG